MDAELAGLGQDRLPVTLERAGGRRGVRDGRRLRQGAGRWNRADQQGRGDENGAHGFFHNESRLHF
ncbi:hypothetical protein D3C72_2064870 [compost metagenome]